MLPLQDGSTHARSHRFHLLYTHCDKVASHLVGNQYICQWFGNKSCLQHFSFFFLNFGFIEIQDLADSGTHKNSNGEWFQASVASFTQLVHSGPVVRTNAMETLECCCSSQAAAGAVTALNWCLHALDWTCKVAHQDKAVLMYCRTHNQRNEMK